MSYFKQQNRHRLTVGQDGNALTMLIAITLICFVILAFIKIVYYFSMQSNAGFAVFHRNFFVWVTLPADTEVLLERPWTILTHMFVHETRNIWHILGNLVWLWTFGYILQDIAGNRKIIPLFLYGAFAGALAYVVSFNLIGPLQDLAPNAHYFGASAGIMALAIGVTTLAPNYRIFPMLNGGIPVWVITILYVIIDLATLPESNPGVQIAHISGGLMGFLTMMMLQRGYDWSLWMNNLYDWFADLFNPDKPQKGNTIRSQLFYKARIQPYTKTPTITQQRVDEILDKINQKGYNALTEDEKEILKRASQDGI